VVNRQEHVVLTREDRDPVDRLGLEPDRFRAGSFHGEGDEVLRAVVASQLIDLDLG